MEGPPLAGAGDSRFRMRLRLEPVGPSNAPDLWLVHNDEVSYWYDNEKLSVEAAGRARATVTRRLCTVAGFYKYAVEDELLDHSPAVHVRRPRLNYESHASGWTATRSALSSSPRG